MDREPDCIEVVELVTAYLEDAMDPADREAFELHLEKCWACANYVEQIRIAIERVGHVETEDLSPELRDNLVTAFRDWRNG